MTWYWWHYVYTKSRYQQWCRYRMQCHCLEYLNTILVFPLDVINIVLSIYALPAIMFSFQKHRAHLCCIMIFTWDTYIHKLYIDKKWMNSTHVLYVKLEKVWLILTLQYCIMMDFIMWNIHLHTEPMQGM